MFFVEYLSSQIEGRRIIVVQLLPSNLQVLVAFKLV